MSIVLRLKTSCIEWKVYLPPNPSRSNHYYQFVYLSRNQLFPININELLTEIDLSSVLLDLKTFVFSVTEWRKVPEIQTTRLPFFCEPWGVWHISWPGWKAGSFAPGRKSRERSWNELVPFPHSHTTMLLSKITSWPLSSSFVFPLCPLCGRFK